MKTLSARTVKLFICVAGFFLFIGVLFTGQVLMKGFMHTPGQLFRARYFAQAHLLSNGKVLLTGGLYLREDHLNFFTEWRLFWMRMQPGMHMRMGYSGPTIENALEFELFDPTTNTWSLTGDKIDVDGSLSLGSNRIFLIKHNEISIYDATNKSMRAWQRMPDYIASFSCALLNDKNIVVYYFSSDETSTLSAGLCEYDIEHNKVQIASIHKLPDNASVPSMIPTQDGNFLLLFSDDNDLKNPVHCEIYDSKHQTWSHLTNLSKNVCYKTVVLASGHVMIIDPITRQCQLLDPLSGRLTSCASMVPFIGNMETGSTILLNNNQVLYIGSTCEIYDPIMDKWTLTGSMNFPRFEFADCLLKSGKVLIAGGSKGFNSSPTDSCELYDPATGIWTQL